MDIAQRAAQTGAGSQRTDIDVVAGHARFVVMTASIRYSAPSTLPICAAEGCDAAAGAEIAPQHVADGLPFDHAEAAGRCITS